MRIVNVQAGRAGPARFNGLRVAQPWPTAWPVSPVTVTHQRTPGALRVPRAISRLLWAVTGPKPASSPGISVRPSRLASGIVRFTVPVRPPAPGGSGRLAPGPAVSPGGMLAAGRAVAAAALAGSAGAAAGGLAGSGYPVGGVSVAGCPVGGASVAGCGLSVVSSEVPVVLSVAGVSVGGGPVVWFASALDPPGSGVPGSP